MKFDELDEFGRDLKRLLKKYKSLREDLAVVKKILTVMPDERPPFSCLIDHASSAARVIKLQKIACKSLKGAGVNSGLNLIYAHVKGEKRIVMMRIYDRNEKQNDNRKLIRHQFSDSA